MIIHYLKFIFLLTAAIVLTNCSNPNETQTPSAGYAAHTSDSIAFVRSEGPDPACYLCKDAPLYISKNFGTKVTCFAGTEYTVMKREIDSLEQNQYYIFKSKGQAGATLNLVEKEALFTFKEDLFNYIEGINGKYLFIDYGTAAQNRMFKIYDMEIGKILVQDGYFDGGLEFDGTTVSYWISTGLKKDSVCPGPQEWEANGNSTMVVEKIKMNLQHMERESTKQYECRMQE